MMLPLIVRERSNNNYINYMNDHFFFKFALNFINQVLCVLRTIKILGQLGLDQKSGF